MFEFTPSQLGTMSLIGQGAGLFTSAIGNYFGAKSQAANLQFQADMSEINARMSETSAQAALRAGHQQIASATLRAGQIKSAQRNAMSANGVDLGEGSAAETLASTELMKEIDKNTLEANAVRSAWGYRTQAVNQQNDALIKRASASGINPGMSAFTTLLGGAGSVASSWYMMNKSGIFDNAPSNGGMGGGTGITMDGGGLGIDPSRSGFGLRY